MMMMMIWRDNIKAIVRNICDFPLKNFVVSGSFEVMAATFYGCGVI
jgi:hypothetical protein